MSVKTDCQNITNKLNLIQGNLNRIPEYLTTINNNVRPSSLVAGQKKINTFTKLNKLINNNSLGGFAVGDKPTVDSVKSLNKKDLSLMNNGLQNVFYGSSHEAITLNNYPVPYFISDNSVHFPIHCSNLANQMGSLSFDGDINAFVNRNPDEIKSYGGVNYSYSNSIGATDFYTASGTGDILGYYVPTDSVTRYPLTSTYKTLDPDLYTFIDLNGNEKVVQLIQSTASTTLQIARVLDNSRLGHPSNPWENEGIVQAKFSSKVSNYDGSVFCKYFSKNGSIITVKEGNATHLILIRNIKGGDTYDCTKFNTVTTSTKGSKVTIISSQLEVVSVYVDEQGLFYILVKTSTSGNYQLWVYDMSSTQVTNTRRISISHISNIPSGSNHQILADRNNIVVMIDNKLYYYSASSFLKVVTLPSTPNKNYQIGLFPCIGAGKSFDIARNGFYVYCNVGVLGDGSANIYRYLWQDINNGFEIIKIKHYEGGEIIPPTPDPDPDPSGVGVKWTKAYSNQGATICTNWTSGTIGVMSNTGYEVLNSSGAVLKTSTNISLPRVGFYGQFGQVGNFGNTFIFMTEKKILVTDENGYYKRLINVPNNQNYKGMLALTDNGDKISTFHHGSDSTITESKYSSDFATLVSSRTLDSSKIDWGVQSFLHSAPSLISSTEVICNKELRTGVWSLATMWNYGSISVYNAYESYTPTSFCGNDEFPTISPVGDNTVLVVRNWKGVELRSKVLNCPKTYANQGLQLDSNNNYIAVGLITNKVNRGSYVDVTLKIQVYKPQTLALDWEYTITKPFVNQWGTSAMTRVMSVDRSGNVYLVTKNDIIKIGK